jgi:hypothetical protein
LRDLTTCRGLFRDPMQLVDRMRKRTIGTADVRVLTGLMLHQVKLGSYKVGLGSVVAQL